MIALCKPAIIRQLARSFREGEPLRESLLAKRVVEF